MADYLEWNQYNYATNLFKNHPGVHYILPKSKFLFFVHFKISANAQRFTSIPDVNRRLGFMVKTADRPNIQYNIQEFNQYNKKVLVTTGLTHPAINITLHDTVDEVAFKMVKDYTDFYYNDMSQELSNWRNTVVNGKSHANLFGYRIRGNTSDIEFFDSIDIYEFYNGYYTKYSLANPRIESVSMGTNDYSASEGNEISLSIKPAGVVYDKLAADITQEVADLVGLPYRTGSTNNFKYIGSSNARVVGAGLNLDRSIPMYKLPTPTIGSTLTSSVGSFLGNIASGIISNVLVPAAANFVAGTLTNAGLGIFSNTATQGIMSAGASLASRAARLF